MARTRLPFRRRLTGPHAVLDFPLMHEMAEAGATDYFGLPLPFADDTPVQLTFATDRPGGFGDDDIRTFHDLALVLARLAETFALRVRVERVLNTYVGRDAGKAVTAEAGEILKFMGDGVLAIFPVTDRRPMAQAALASLRACHAIGTGFQVWNEQRRSAGQPPLGFGLAVDCGEVMYGNVGASGRLDFTAIGPVVNAVSRLQSLCRELGRPILVSRRISDFWPDYCEKIGQRQLRGLAQETEVFALLPTAFKSSAMPAR